MLVLNVGRFILKLPWLFVIGKKEKVGKTFNKKLTSFLKLGKYELILETSQEEYIEKSWHQA